MKPQTALSRFTALLLVLILITPPGAFGQDEGEPGFTQPELDQLCAPIALYPDSLLTQILMASTYPLEVVQAARWAEQNKNLKGDALATKLEEQSWDPSVKSLVNFPDVLKLMSEKLDWVERMGDAFLSQQEDVMNTIQNLREKAQDSGNLKTTKEQVVVVEKETIIIEPAEPEVVYVPTYDPAVVYGPWWYPAYPPISIYPPGYVFARAGFAFATGVAIGLAWGYAWGHADWHHHNIRIDNSVNIKINKRIKPEKYTGRGDWKHEAKHRKGVAYRDNKTAQKFNRGRDAKAVKSREAFRGRAESGRRDLSKGGAKDFKDTGGRANRLGGSKGESKDSGERATRLGSSREETRDFGDRPSRLGSSRDDGGRDRSGSTRDIGGRDRSARTDRGGAFGGINRGGAVQRDRDRGRSSRESMSNRGRGGGFGGGGRGGGGRGGGGGRRR